MSPIRKTAIILVTYGHWDQTENCLKDLFKNGSENFRVIVVDNGSADDTLENIRRDFPQVHLIVSKRNRGFGAANNLGISHIEDLGEAFDSIFILNNDMRIPEGAIKSLQETLECYPDAVIVPQLLNTDGSVQKNWFSEIPAVQFFLNAFRSEKSAERYVNGTTVPVKGSHLLEAQWTNAAAWLMKLSTWKSVGGFDENIFMYYEDVDWAYRARALGVKFLIDPGVSLTHLGGGSAKSNLSRSLQHDSSQLYFYRKHFGIRGALLSRSFRAVRSLVRVILQIPAMPISKNARASVKLHTKLFLFALGLFRYRR